MTDNATAGSERSDRRGANGVTRVAVVSKVDWVGHSRSRSVATAGGRCREGVGAGGPEL